MKTTPKELESPRSPPGRIACLDAFRGAAALFVLWFHVCGDVYGRSRIGLEGDWWTATDPLAPSYFLFLPLIYGESGVALFFVLSGFVIHFSVLRAERLEPAAFFQRRFWRLYPAYVTALGVFIFAAWRQHPDQIDPVKNFLAYFFALQNLSSSTYHFVNPSFWSLAVEVQFYLLYPLFYAAGRRYGCGRALFGTFLVCTVGRVIAACLQDWGRPLSPPLWLNTHTLWFDWALGAYLAERFVRGERVFARPGPWAAVFVPLFLAAPFFKPLSPLGFTFGSVLSALALENRLAASGSAGGIGGKIEMIFGSVGIYSYSLYLFHQPLLRSIAVASGIDRLPDPAVRMVLLLAAGTILNCAAAWLVHRTIETGGESLGRSLWSRRRETPIPSAAAPPTPSPAPIPDEKGEGAGAGTEKAPAP